MSIDLDALGICKNELQERVIDNIVNQVWYDDDGVFLGKISSLIEDRVAESIEALAEKHILPRVDEFVNTVILQETTRWGEAKGGPKTILEFMADCAENYLLEKVDSNGKPVSRDVYNWTDKQTRLTYLVNESIRREIGCAMGQVAKDINVTMAKALTETVKIKLEEITKAMKVIISSH